MKKLDSYCILSMIACLVSFIIILSMGGYPESRILSWILWGLLANGIVAFIVTAIFILPQFKKFKKNQVISKPEGSTWNYRVATEMHVDSKTRLYHIVEVYYTNGEPEAFAKREPLSNWEDLEDLKGTHAMVAKAFNAPIIDLDNFPKAFIQ